MTTISAYFDGAHCYKRRIALALSKTIGMPRPFIKEAVQDEERLLSLIRDKAYSLTEQKDIQPLFDRIGDAQLVILEEASHGTHEYYTWRSYITQRLIKERGFKFIGSAYHPDYKQYGNYVPSLLPMRYDAFIYLEETHALHPLHIEPDGHQIPETYPFEV